MVVPYSGSRVVSPGRATIMALRLERWIRWMNRDDFDIHPPEYEILKREGLEGGERGFSVSSIRWGPGGLDTGAKQESIGQELG